MDVIEQIAIQWFRASGGDRVLARDLWDRQPDDIKKIHRQFALDFWMQPNRAHRRNSDLLHRLDGMLNDYRRGYDCGQPIDDAKPK